LSKWLFKLLTTDGTWKQLLRNKYLGSKPLVQVERKQGDSHFWASLLKVKYDFLRFGSFIIKDGSQARFWEDKWLGNESLMNQYPGLYNIVRPKFVIISEALSSYPPNFSWRRDLIGPKLVEWNHLLARLANFSLSQGHDEFYWSLHPNGQFSVNSHYKALIQIPVPNLNKRLWKLKAPLKLKILCGILGGGSANKGQSN
jgi:hypothetical protein